jgi:glutamate-1-semialdehyde 2,1-aminomutase
MSTSSKDLYSRALEHLPGGNSRTTVFVPPRPPYARRGLGYRIEDVDGHEVIDLQNNYTSLIHGHAHPSVVAAAVAAIESGASFGMPTESEIEMAAALSTRVPWATRWRFANSGTEAVMMAIRLARASSGKDKILRFEGAYHGSYDAAMMPGAPGIARSVAADIITAPFGEIEPVLEAIDAHGDEIACVLFDAMPSRAGLRPASQEFVEQLREATRRHDVLLVQDEVLTFRVGYGGLHSHYGIDPDLIAVGKVVGGGFPIGAFGGPADLMQSFDPRIEGALAHGGTFSANPVTMRAGATALKLFSAAEVDRLNGMGDRLRVALIDQGWEVTGRGSLMRLHVEDDQQLWWDLYRSGILAANNGLLCLSTPMDEGALTEIISKIGAAHG